MTHRTRRRHPQTSPSGPQNARTAHPEARARAMAFWTLTLPFGDDGDDDPPPDPPVPGPRPGQAPWVA